MKQMDKLKSKLNSLSERGSFRRIIIVIGALGIALILFSDHLPFGRSTGGTQTRTAEAYAAELEKSLESFLSTVEGAGKTRVLLTMENSAETVYVANGAAKTKEIKLRAAIDTNDYNTKIKRAIEFLNHGNKLKLSLMFRGREMSHTELGFELIKKFADEIKSYGALDSEPKMFGKVISTTLSPCSKNRNKQQNNISQSTEQSAFAKVLDANELLELK